MEKSKMKCDKCNKETGSDYPVCNDCDEDGIIG